MRNLRLLILFPFFIFLYSFIHAQDFGFGFGFDDFDEETSSFSTSSASSALSFKAGGEITMELPLYFKDFLDQEITAGDMISGKLNLSLSSTYIDAFVNFNLNAAAFGSFSDLVYTPLFMDEAYIRVFLNPVNIEAGLRKLSWGKADSSGPLDVTNPVDYSDLRKITDSRARKIARPMIHITWNTGNFSKLEGVFIPNFAGHRFASDGRWAPSIYSNMLATAEAGIFLRAAELYETMFTNPSLGPALDGVRDNLLAYFSDNPVAFPSTSSLRNFQAGLRFTTTIGPADFGAQYYYGTLFRPGFTVNGVDKFLDDLAIGILGTSPPASINLSYPGKPAILSPQIKYTRFHQIGVDYAQVLFGFNIRAETALNLTEDFRGDKGSLQNPFIGWSLGFDRDLIWGINMNFQCNETIRLFNSKIGNNPVLDTEADTKVTSTRLTMQLSKTFFRDNLESKITAIWDIENADCYIIPAVIWIVGDLTTEISAGIFAGKESGELGQYRDNSFIRLGLTYHF